MEESDDYPDMPTSAESIPENIKEVKREVHMNI